jgi:hypothetical protein
VYERQELVRKYGDSKALQLDNDLGVVLESKKIEAFYLILLRIPIGPTYPMSVVMRMILVTGMI